MDLIWTVSHPTLTGAERCRLQRTPTGWLLAGVVVALHDGRPLDARYRVAVDDDWATRSVDVTIDELADRRVRRLERDHRGGWRVDGEPAPDLEGCVDVDLGITPCTNTLPIRRLALDVGQQRDVEVVWVRFPGLWWERARQSYRRRTRDVWEYRSGAFTADLAVDDDGLVIRYGDDLWRRRPPDGH